MVVLSLCGKKRELRRALAGENGVHEEDVHRARDAFDPLWGEVFENPGEVRVGGVVRLNGEGVGFVRNVLRDYVAGAEEDGVSGEELRPALAAGADVGGDIGGTGDRVPEVR